jgi:hypothetical protein
VPSSRRGRRLIAVPQLPDQPDRGAVHMLTASCGFRRVPAGRHTRRVTVTGVGDETHRE